MSGGGARVSIPAGMHRTIQNLKEIAGNHSDEEIYATLRECSMDPNETVQKLLLQDTFHEVKRKRDKKKEGTREPADPRWRIGVQGRGGRGGRGNYSSRSVPNDSGAGRNTTPGKQNGLNLSTETGNASSSTSLDTENYSAIPLLSSVSGHVNGSSSIDHPISPKGSYGSGAAGIAPLEKGSDAVTTKIGNSRTIPNHDKSGSSSGQSVRDLDRSSNKTVSVPSLDSVGSVQLGTIKQVLRTNLNVTETATSEVKPQGSGTVDELSEKHQVSSSLFPGAIGNRQSSTNNSRFQHSSCLQKAPLPNKEWKPKSVIHVNPAQASETNDPVDVAVAAEAVVESLPESNIAVSDGGTIKLENKLEELKLSDRQHVIIPNHLQVPESARHGLSFGSFDANFELNIVTANGSAREKIDKSLYELTQEIEETTEQPSMSIHAMSSAAKEAKFSESPQSPEQVPDSYSTKEADVSTNTPAAVQYDQSKQDAALTPEEPQNLVVPSASSYPSIGLVPQLGSQFTPFETSEPQARDASRLPSFLVPQPYDPSTSYYTPFYRPVPDADGRISPFLPSGASTRYSGNISVLPAQTGQASQENANSIVLSTVGSTPLATQAAGALQGSVAIPQQPVPVFRQPAGLQISHYPPNYMPYSQYFSPFYVPPPTLHHFLSSAAFPQQPPAGNMYPNPAAAAPATSVKYPLPQYKPGSNAGNSTIVGLPTVYGTYNSTHPGYSSGPSVSTGNTTTNEDLGSSQFKENNVYIPGQQSEGPAVWIPAQGRDISPLQASSFYSIPQGQHMTFAPTQAGHGAFSGIYPPTPSVASSVHPLLQQSQTVAGAVELLGPPAGVYQQPQRAQINWTNNY